VISLHGDLTSFAPAKSGDIKAALLVVHGAADPVSPKAQRDAFENEMQAASASWQMLTFGHLVHSFCEPEANVGHCRFIADRVYGAGLSRSSDQADRTDFGRLDH
ncbi:MAG: dienelactone hydrolase family protein, partial [Bradyrhizobiaceae bacterium]|nr:dienelactone hydrolase family protein [Bradyrhizobiaceae bacterium]